MTPLVTVIIPSYNAGKYLRLSMQSVLVQSYSNLEIIVVDDGSTDGSTDFIGEVNDARIHVINQKNSGKPVALNRALDEMKGAFYALQDADDISHPLRIERQLEVLLREKDVAAVYCGHDLVMGEKHCAPRFREKGRKACRIDIDNFHMPAHDPTGMYRVSMVGHMRYSESLPVVEGCDYVFRVGELYPVVVLGECLYSYRIHAESITRKDPSRRVQLERLVRQLACERRGLSFDELFPNEATLTSDSCKVLDNGLATDFMESVVDLRGAGRYLDAVKNGIRCARLRPTEPHYYKALLYALIPEGLRQRIRSSERVS